MHELFTRVLLVRCCLKVPLTGNMSEKTQYLASLIIVLISVSVLFWYDSFFWYVKEIVDCIVQFYASRY